MEETLKEFHRAGYKIGIATVKPEVFAVRIAKHFGVEKYFDFIAGSELDNSRDKKSDVIIRAMENIAGALPENTVMIGDRDYDILAAKELGLYSVGAAYGYGSEAELTAAGADRLVFTAAEIPEAVRSIFRK